MNTHIQDICKVGKGAECCRYLLAGKGGWFCGKITGAWKDTIDENWARHAHIAQGDNCEGKQQAELNS